ncbi:hypothetical protein ASE17_02690 [Phenylobacterium sp. Root77]|uniref:DUF3667 domain-containing protein n=1 Tax=unclassified Phenylobacterium TaxID=2640670 RepID=UPI0006F49D33|nr:MULTISPECIES: DUF3667 domain-containing protein [unclassified Phenylobacterium]KQW71809.1 hypothetical protein ASC73_06915 [Phenylobacterium sp. Root1277]KQW94729.1 hypothetical protein ASC79_03060 [Phenylobacterium sp. Root1290]KRC44422.1 hypothetical protein ASE17_02690 [Phenylobacterium sp. Root77]
MDVDSTGGAVTGAMVAAAIEKPTGLAGAHSHHCDDCGAEVTGRFCADCGQTAHTHRTLLHLGEEILHGVMHFDSRIWRTLPLLVGDPGRLTREWVAGKRTRYVSPLAMYLFTVFVMFMILSFMPVNTQIQTAENAVRDAASGPASTGTAYMMATNEVVQAELALTEAPQGEDPASIAKRAELTTRLAVAREAERAADAAMQEAPTAPNVAVMGANLADNLRDAVANGDLKVNTGDKALDKKLLKKLQNPELTLYKLQQTFYKFSFLLIPISIPFVALLFLWKRGFTLYDHGVFVLYSLTFMAMLIMLTAGVMRFGGVVAALAALAASIAAPVHMFAQVKGAYGLSTFSALWRTVMLLLFCSLALALFLAAVVMLGVAG